MGVREWAKEESTARKILQTVDEDRTRYLTVLIKAAGSTDADACRRAQVADLAWLGSYSHSLENNLAQRQASMECLCDRLLG